MISLFISGLFSICIVFVWFIVIVSMLIKFTFVRVLYNFIFKRVYRLFFKGELASKVDFLKNSNYKTLSNDSKKLSEFR